MENHLLVWNILITQGTNQASFQSADLVVFAIDAVRASPHPTGLSNNFNRYDQNLDQQISQPEFSAFEEMEIQQQGEQHRQ